MGIFEVVDIPHGFHLSDRQWSTPSPLRVIPLLPYSKEVGKLKRLKQGLALYRMVFGQPRQEDLIFCLSQNGSCESANLAEWLISLEPPIMDLET